ncbi:hypothetical protein [Novosphingobium sp. Rr 2-17]
MLKIKIQIHCGKDVAMGPGNADLLEAIRRNGSMPPPAGQWG